MFPDSIMSWLGIRLLKSPPDSWINKIPAATSQGRSPNSQKPSSLPQATYAKSSAAAPGLLIPAAF